jgi:hypothetical protein
MGFEQIRMSQTKALPPAFQFNRVLGLSLLTEATSRRTGKTFASTIRCEPAAPSFRDCLKLLNNQVGRVRGHNTPSHW